MNKKITVLAIFSVLVTTISVQAGGLLELGRRLSAPDKLFTGIEEQRKNQLEILTQDLADLQKKKVEEDSQEQLELTELVTQKEQAQTQLKEDQDSAVLQRKIAIISEIIATIKDLERVRQDLIDTLEDAIKVFSDYLNDPDFQSFKKERKLGTRPFYSFEDVQKIHELISEVEKRRLLMVDKERTTQAELENRRRSLGAIKEQLKERRSDLEALYKKEDAGTSDLSMSQLRELLMLENQLNKYKEELSGLRIKDTEYRLALFGMQLFIVKAHKKILEEYLIKVKPEVQVSQSEIAEAQDELNAQKQRYYASKDKIQQEYDTLSGVIKKKEQAVEELAKKHGISLDSDWDIWLSEPYQTVESYVGYCEVGTAAIELGALLKKQQLLDAQLALEDERLAYYKFQLQTRETYYKMATKKFANEEEIVRERKRYDSALSEAKARLALYKERITFNAELMSQTKKMLDNVARFKQNVETQKATLFKGKNREYSRCMELFKVAEQQGQDQIDSLSKLTGVYSSITTQLSSILRLLEFITTELESKTILARPESAIPWQEIKNFGPDIFNFFADLSRAFLQVSIAQAMGWLHRLARDMYGLIMFIFGLCLLLLVLYGIRRLVDPLAAYAMQPSEQYQGLVRVAFLLVGGIAGFVASVFWWIALWIFCYGFLLLLPAPKTYLLVTFYLISIPYLLYLANRFIKYMAQLNIRYEYAFLAPEFQRRFVYVMAGLTYATIVILFFRAAFMLANYRSDLPTILLALNFIIFQISLILLIDKEQILHLIPTRTQTWQRVYDLVSRYYYILQMGVIAIIIMSNPYVGFGKLVLYILFGLIYTSLLVAVLVWLYNMLKRGASELFFSEKDDVVKERFDNAKTWFGVVVILSFLLCGFIGFIVTARIWGWHITWIDVQEVFETRFGGTAADPITLLSIIHIVLFLIGGLAVAYGINRFVLDKIFDLLLIDAGVQHTVTSILQYLIVAVAIFFGFNYAGLGTVVNYIIGALILGLSWMLKDPINDFVAYFIILVQRPIKIGDYIKIDPETSGVVRRITPRSVILRKKNSITVVVPNTYVISRSIRNWNYARNFFALDDLTIIVTFDEDPARVRQTLYEIIETQPNILRNPKPVVRLDKIGDYGFEFMLRCFVSSNYTLEQWNLASELRIVIIQEFRARGIQLAVPILQLLGKHINQQSQQKQE